MSSKKRFAAAATRANGNSVSAFGETPAEARAKLEIHPDFVLGASIREYDLEALLDEVDTSANTNTPLHQVRGKAA